VTASFPHAWIRWSVAVAPLAAGAAAAWLGAGKAACVIAAGAAGAAGVVYLTTRAERALRAQQDHLSKAEREAAEAREEAERRAAELAEARGVLEASPWPMFATHASGEIFLANRGAEEFFQRGPGGLVGRSIEDLVTQAGLISLHAEAVAGRAASGQVRIERSEGTRVYQVRAAPVRLGHGGAGAVVSLRDITELATALQLKTDFVANASHELRTPVASIRAAVETLADGAWEEPALRTKFTQMIAGNVRRLEELISDLLELSRLESPEGVVKVEEFDLPELLADVEEELRPIAAERELTLSMNVDGVQRVRSDPRLVRLVVRNLVDNAVKFAYPQTTVRVEVSALPSSDGNTGMRVRVIDRGIGIPIHQQKRVFERFFQVDPARTGFQHRRGSGLGLAIVKHAVKALGGAVGLESVWKQGTTMTVELPACVVTSSQG
jgi:two-component system phosphate regulon sensor histidine kinase PhoR